MPILDSGNRREFETGFVRDMGEGKGRMDLLPWRAIIEWSKHSEKGALKYGERNIDKGCPISVLLDSALRHIAKYLEGDNDEDHLSAALWNTGWAKQMEITRSDMQDIPNRVGLASLTNMVANSVSLDEEDEEQGMIIPVKRHRDDKEKIGPPPCRTIKYVKEYLQLRSDAPNEDKYPEIVRCKDCKGYRNGICWIHSTDGLGDGRVLVHMRPDDFCNYGIRWKK